MSVQYQFFRTLLLCARIIIVLNYHLFSSVLFLLVLDVFSDTRLGFPSCVKCSSRAGGSYCLTQVWILHISEFDGWLVSVCVLPAQGAPSFPSWVGRAPPDLQKTDRMERNESTELWRPRNISIQYRRPRHAYSFSSESLMSTPQLTC